MRRKAHILPERDWDLVFETASVSASASDCRADCRCRWVSALVSELVSEWDPYHRPLEALVLDPVQAAA